MSTANSPPAARALIRSTAVQGTGESIFRLVPAALASMVVHVLLIGALVFLLDAPGDAKTMLESTSAANRSLNTFDKRNLRSPEEKKKLHLDKLDSMVVNPMAKDPDFDPIVKSETKADKAVQINDLANPLEPPGTVDGTKEIALTTIPKSYGVPNPQSVGSLDNMLPGGPQPLTGAVGLPKGTDLSAMSLNAGGNYGRGNAELRDSLLKAGGGSPASEVAVNMGLKFLKRMQKPDGHWKLDDEAYEGSKGQPQNTDIAATAFGMLPFLGRGITIEPVINGEKNPYVDVVQKAVSYLKSKQEKNGALGQGYTHALATLALSELYGMVKDEALKKSIHPVVEKAVKRLIDAQGPDGGWRYGYRDAKGDLSVTGWVIMALKSADMSGIPVPKAVMEKAAKYVESLGDPATEGYAYEAGQGPTSRMSVVGLLCRQYMDGWNASNIRLIKGVENYIVKVDVEKGTAKLMKNPDEVKDIYFYYYATQVAHHFGEEHWPAWNEAMRDNLIKTQLGSDKNRTPAGKEKLEGSWDPAGDQWGTQGGRLMYTSLALLTLEVYYRHLPLYYKDMVSGVK